MRFNLPSFFYASCLFFLTMPLYANQAEQSLSSFTPASIVKVKESLHQSLREGPYVGAGFGYDTYKIRQGVTIEFPDLDPYVFNPALNAKGWLFEFLLGYGLYYQNFFYLGAELLYNRSYATTGYRLSSSLNYYEMNFNARSSYGVSLLPGIKFNDSTLFFFKIGYLRTLMRYQEQATQGVLFPVFNNLVTPWRNGMSYGLGIESLLKGRWSLRGEYDFILYQTYRLVNENTFTPSNNQFSAAVIYHFM